MKVRAFSLPCLLVTCFAMVSVSLAQDDAPPRRFTTGPPAIDDRGPRPGLGRGNMLTPPGVAGAPDSADILVNQVLSQPQNETSFAVNPNDDDNWVGVANDYRSGNVETGWYSTLDGGQTWTTGTFGIDAGFSFSGDPCVTFDVNGDVHIVCMMYFGPGGSKVTHFRSSNGGLTWSSGTNISLRSGNDKPQVDSDFSNGAFRGSVTTAWDEFSTPSGDHVLASTSLDGVSWSAAQRINGNVSVTAISPDVAYGPSSEIYVMWAERGAQKAIWLDKSTDGGATWSSDVFVTSFTALPFTLPGSTFRIFDIFAISADWTTGPNSGNVYIAYHTLNNNRADVRCVVSTDGGQTWPTNNLVHPSAAAGSDQMFPGICVDPRGNVNVTYYDRRLDPGNLLLWTWVSRSSDGGATYSEHRASDVGWNHLNEGTFGGGFIGDYIDVAYSSRGIHPFWCDGRTNDLDVYTDAMNLDLYSDVDTISASAGGTAQFTINAGPNLAGSTYLLLASGSGTTPGLTLPSGVNIPLNIDVFTQLSLTLANTAILPNSFGVLDGTGSASAGLSTLGPQPSLAGLTLDFAVVVFATNPVYATLPTRIVFTP
ncbi:MAG: sialidase family protein [Planctomycetota bacterium]